MYSITISKKDTYKALKVYFVRIYIYTWLKLYLGSHEIEFYALMIKHEQYIILTRLLTNN